MVMTAQEFVENIAVSNPIHGTTWDTNECRFCESSWAENTYEEYLENQRLFEQGKQVVKGNRVMPKWEHHNNGCLWVIANEITRA